jgi:hypothetical protein
MEGRVFQKVQTGIVVDLSVGYGNKDATTGSCFLPAGVVVGLPCGRSRA